MAPQVFESNQYTAVGVMSIALASIKAPQVFESNQYTAVEVMSTSTCSF